MRMCCEVRVQFGELVLSLYLGCGSWGSNWVMGREALFPAEPPDKSLQPIFLKQGLSLHVALLFCLDYDCPDLPACAPYTQHDAEVTVASDF